MKKIELLANYDHPLVKDTAAQLTKGLNSDREKLKALFYYVKDQVKFAFPKNGDLVKASETIQLRIGQCNTKGTLLLALCKASGIEAIIHFSLIRKEIQQGLFKGLMFRLIPNLISHSWVDVRIEGKWRRIDSFINDERFYIAGKAQLKKKGWKTGYSVSCASGESDSGFNIDEEKFVQMDAVVEDQGVWADPAEYYSTNLYKNRPGRFKLIVYGLLVGRVNKRVEALRQGCGTDQFCSIFNPAT